MEVRYINGADEHCWFNPSNCELGISASIWEKIIFFRDDPAERYIYSTGADASGGTGMAVYFKGIYFYAMVSTGKELWNLTVPGPVRNNTWNEIGIRWSKDVGLEIFINAQKLGHVLYPDVVSGGPRDDPMELTVGCRKAADGQYMGFAHGEYDELTVWMWALEEDQESFYIGGQNCDPNASPLVCETNIEKILENMDNMKLDDADSLIEALNHINMLSQVEKDPKGSEGEEDINAEKKYKKEVRILVAIVEKLIQMTWDEPDAISVSNLGKLMTIQDITSNVLEEKYTAGWGEMTNEGKSSVNFVNKVNAYQLHKTTQTDSGKEPITLKPNSANIQASIQRSSLYQVLATDKPIEFPPADEEEDEEEDESKRRKRETGGETEESEEPPAQNIKFSITEKMFGELNKRDKVTFVGCGYKKLNKISPLWNKRTGNDTKLVFIDSEIVSATSDPNASSSNLQRDPLLVTLKHIRKAKASGRKLLADKDLQENGEIRDRDCMRWDPNMETKGCTAKGGWSTDGGSLVNSTADETTCQFTMLGTYAILAKIRQPFYIPPEEEWVKLVKWIGFGLSISLLIFYIIVIVIRGALHEEYHIIRLNLAIAALGAQISFLLSGFLYDDEDICRILSVLIHMFYTAVGTWFTAESHALFSGLVNGNFGGKFTFYVMIGWVFPAGMVGGCFSVIHNYGYDYRCLVGPSPSLRMLLIGPILVGAAVAFTFSIITCINYGTPAVKRTAIVNELSSATRSSFIVIILFLSTWLCAIFAIVDLGFDGGEIPAFNPIFQILNSCLGIFIVALIGLGSKHFRYSLCHSGRNRTHTKSLSLDPFDIHDKANISNRKKIYAS